MDYSRKLKTAESPICLYKPSCTTKHDTPLAKRVPVLCSQRNAMVVIFSHFAFAPHRKISALHPRP